MNINLSIIIFDKHIRNSNNSMVELAKNSGDPFWVLVNQKDSFKVLISNYSNELNFI